MWRRRFRFSTCSVTMASAASRFIARAPPRGGWPRFCVRRGAENEGPPQGDGGCRDLPKPPQEERSQAIRMQIRRRAHRLQTDGVAEGESTREVIALGDQ